MTQPPGFDPVDFTCDATLPVGSVTVRGDQASTTVPTADEAERLAQQLLRTEDDGSPRDRRGRVALEPTC